MAVVVYQDLSHQQDLIDLLSLLKPKERSLIIADNLDSALKNLDDIVIVIASAEPTAVQELDGRREAFMERTAPAVLFLQAGGEAIKLLQQSYSLFSWIRGNRLIDPNELDSINETEAGADFLQKSGGLSPKEWLEKWRAGSVPDTQENAFILHCALMLENE